MNLKPLFSFNRPWISSLFLLIALAVSIRPGFAGNFYAGTSPATVPWPGGVVPYEFTNTLSAAQRQTYLDGLREWELAANVKFVPHTNQTRWVLFTYSTSGQDMVSPGYNPQVVTVDRLSRAQVCHEMGHSFGFTHENIRPDQTNYLIVVTNNILNEPANIVWFTIDPTSVTNGNYDFESVMHLGWDFDSVQPGVLATQQPRPLYFPRYQFRMGNLCLSPGDRAALRFLYGAPAVPPTNVVATTADSGPGSLRAAIYYATDNPGTPVRFNIPISDPGYSNGVFTIHLTGYLPPLATNGIVIDGSTQPGFAGNPLIVVDGSQMIPEAYDPGTVTGLLIYGGSCQVKNLSFQNFNWNGITLEHTDATNNTIAGCWLGLDATGTNGAPNAYEGILVCNGAGGNIIGGTNAVSRNVLSGNLQYGIFLTNTAGNTVLGNYIGTDPGGAIAVPNGYGGVILRNNTSNNLIGGTNANARNVISGNVSAGIWLTDAGTINNAVRGNYVGLNATGTTALPNTFVGMYLIGGAQSNLVSGNVFSGNYSEGLRVADPGTSFNTVQGNFFGTDASGLNPVPNYFAGLTIFNGATSNLMGGTAASARNIISGNGSYGFALGDPGTSGNLIEGNYIGLAPDGLTPVPNFHGVLIDGASSGNTFGGTSGGARNVISGNFGSGIFLTNTSGNIIQGNFIGPDATGANAAPNGYEGIYLLTGADGNVIGGTAPGAGNVISGNTYRGIYATGTNITGNLIQGNFIGTKADGTNALGNGWDAIVLFDGASGNVVGLSTGGLGAGNTIAFNGQTGVYVGSDNSNLSLGNMIRGNIIFSNNFIGINLAGGTEDSFGVTANHPGGAVAGPNNLQNYPIITNAMASGTTTKISGTLNSTPNRSFLVDIYRNNSADPSGYGEGQIYVGSTSVNTDFAGNGNFNLTASGNFAGQFVTATATDATTGDTSEFAADVLATNVPVPPSFIGPFSYSSTGFAAQINLTIGQSYHVQATTNLSTNPIPWINVTNFTAAGSPFPFTDRGATNFRARFYRVTSP
jgi:parallel beta-helix repeat protein